ncbi:LEC14B protein [Tanacetum coccineum]
MSRCRDLIVPELSMCLICNNVCFADEASHLIYDLSELLLITSLRLDIRLLDQKEKSVEYRLGHLEGIAYLDSRIDGHYFISNRKNQTIKLWDIRKCSLIPLDRLVGYAGVIMKWLHAIGFYLVGIKLMGGVSQEAAKRLEGFATAHLETQTIWYYLFEYTMLPGGPINGTTMKLERALIEEVTTLENVCWKELGLLVFVWIAFLGLQIAKVLPHPLSPMGDACSRMDLTAIHKILVMTHYNDDELSFQERSQQMRDAGGNLFPTLDVYQIVKMISEWCFQVVYALCALKNTTVILLLQLLAKIKKI